MTDTSDLYFVARCRSCKGPAGSIGTGNRRERDEWAGTHNAVTGHDVMLRRQDLKRVTPRRHNVDHARIKQPHT